MAENMRQPRSEDLLASFIANRISSLQGGYLSPEGRSNAAAKLAALRHAATREVGATPETWSVEFEGVPKVLMSKGDAPSAAERAIHAALTLYATHQQSQTIPMHVRGRDYGLGQAMRSLVYQESGHYENLEPGEMPRRFAALVTAETFDEVAHYARQLVGQLRHARIPLDYALLAQQLYELQLPGRADAVRLAWGRGFAQYKPEVGPDTKDDQ